MKAINIMWDVDYDEDDNLLPTEIEVPEDMEYEDDITNYLSDVTGFCHQGYNLIDEYGEAVIIDGYGRVIRNSKMKTRYYVCGLGYDVNGNITDYEKDYGDFDTYEQAYARFITLQCMSRDVLFANARGVNQLLLRLEECEETDKEVNCIDVRNEWWIVNPNFKEEV